MTGLEKTLDILQPGWEHLNQVAKNRLINIVQNEFKSKVKKL